MDLSKDGKTLYVTSWYSNELRAFDIAYAEPEKPQE
jgi:sugar lactone lactonase YvrE